jgi:hypothetical protein
MTPAEIRALIDAKPFKPFKLHTADGTTIPVPHGDHISLSPSGWQAIVWKPRGGHWVVDIGSVTLVDVAARPHAKAG